MNDTTQPERPPHRYWPLGQLILARVREFVREPEAVFWVYGFPILLVVALGIAFLEKAIDQVRVDIPAGLTAEAVKDKLQDPALAHHFAVQIHDLDTCRMHLRTARTELVVL